MQEKEKSSQTRFDPKLLEAVEELVKGVKNGTTTLAEAMLIATDLAIERQEKRQKRQK